MRINKVIVTVYLRRIRLNKPRINLKGEPVGLVTEAISQTSED